jgi:hypothetical protein
MKKSVVIFLLAVILVGSGCAFFSFLPVPYENLTVETRSPIDITLEPIQDQMNTPTPDGILAVPIIVTKEISRESETPKSIIQVRYPQIEHTDGSATMFNNKIERMMNDFVNSFLLEIGSHTYDEFLSGFTNGLTTDYRVTYIDSNLISINFLQSVYYAGAAHPLPFSETVNYDLAQDRTIELDDLFQDGIEYLPVLSQYALNDLRQQGVLEWEEGASATQENFDSWNITLEGLLFTFDPYQVAPYAAGFQEVLIPYGVIQHLLHSGAFVPPLITE